MNLNSFKRNRKALTALLICTGFIAAHPLAAFAEENVPAVQMVQQQKQSVSGVVKDSTGEPVIGANIREKGNPSNGTITDIDGNFSIKVNPDATLEISFIGYKTVEVKAVAGKPLNVILKDDSEMLEEVVVVGYGTMRKKDLTGSVVQIRPDKLANEAPKTVQDVLRGTPGLNIGYNADAKGGGTMMVRGQRSVYVTDKNNPANDTHNTPLIILDGMQFYGELSEINPEDIGQIDVLKDASAAAIYGSRAANGVVLVTTKGGRLETSARVTVDAYTGVQMVAKYIDVMDGNQLRDLAKATGYSSAEGLLNWNGGAGTDWQKELYNSAMVSKVSLNVSGGNKTSTYNLSGSYLNQDGIVNTTGYEAWNIRAKNTFSFFNNHLRMGTTLMMKFYKKKYEDVSYTSALTAVPMWNVYGEDGTWGVAPEWTRGDNPVGWTEAYDYQRHGIDILLNGYAEVDLFLKGLKYKFNVGINKYTRRNYAYSSPYYFSSTSQKNEAELSESTDWENDWLIENTINYDNTFGNHTVSALVGYSAQRNNARGFGAGRKGFPEGFSVIDAGSVSSQNTSGSAWANTMISMFGRVMYSYADRYMLSASVRRDGSSKFADGNRWGTFPSVSLGWNVMNEDFFENIKETMNELKIRASYGVLGNLSGIGNYATQSVVYKGMNNMMGTELWEGAITGKEWTSPMNVTWEKTKTLNLGLDFAFLNNKFSVSADYFIQKTEDMLLSMPQSLSFGLSGNPTVNAGTVENKGFEISLNHRNNVGDLYYHVGVNATFIKNELTEVNGSRDEWQGFNPHAKGTITYAKTGHSIGYFNLIKTDGVFQSQQEIDAYVDKNGNKIQPNAQPGDLRFVDYNGDGKIDNNDRQDVGSAFPKVNLGVSLGAEWKGLDLNMFFDGNFGNKIYNAQYYTTVYNESTGNQYAERMNSWTENNHSDIPRCLFGTSDPNGTNWGYTDRWLENGSFLRLKTLELGYTLPKVWVSKAGLQNVRVYTAMENLFTITDYKGYTPDLGMVDADGAGTSGGSGVMTRGCDDGRYPMARTITFGLQVNF